MRSFRRYRTIMRMDSRMGGLAVAIAFLVAGCGVDEAAELDAEEPGAPAVYFVQPADGETVTSPVTVVMGARHVEVAPVPEEVETPRHGIVHHHLGTNTDCLPAGTVVPQADPWIHFGDGSNEIEMYLEPGEHRLVAQAGDDEHRTIEGLCRSITITVLPED